jgi:hypothetical protein
MDRDVHHRVHARLVKRVVERSDARLCRGLARASIPQDDRIASRWSPARGSTLGSRGPGQLRNYAGHQGGDENCPLLPAHCAPLLFWRSSLHAARLPVVAVSEHVSSRPPSDQYFILLRPDRHVDRLPLNQMSGWGRGCMKTHCLSPTPVPGRGREGLESALPCHPRSPPASTGIDRRFPLPNL